MKTKTSLAWPLGTIAILLFFGGAAFLWFMLNTPKSFIERILGIAAGIALILIATLLIYLITLSFGKKNNFFLYDYKTKQDISVDDLTFDMILERLRLYFNSIVTKNSWFDAFLESHYDCDIPKVFEPLLPLVVLNDAIEVDNEEVWKAFVSNDKDTIDAIELFVYNGGAHEISSRIQCLKATYNSDITPLREFMLSKKQYIQDLITDYVKANIEKF